PRDQGEPQCDRRQEHCGVELSGRRKGRLLHDSECSNRGYQRKGEAMRRAVIAGLATIGMALGAVRQVPAQAFAGTAHYTIHDENGKINNLTVATKPGHYAVQFTGENGKAGQLIVDSAAGTTTFVNSEDKSYFVITKEMMQGMAGVVQGMAGLDARPAGGRAGFGGAAD